MFFFLSLKTTPAERESAPPTTKESKKKTFQILTVGQRDGDKGRHEQQDDEDDREDRVDGVGLFFCPFVFGFFFSGEKKV